MQLQTQLYPVSTSTPGICVSDNGSGSLIVHFLTKKVTLLFAKPVKCSNLALQVFSLLK